MPDHGRPLSLSLRCDLVVTRESFGKRAHVVVKDPTALRYFRFREEEFALLELLDGRRSLIEIQQALEARFSPQKFTPESMSNFIASIHQTGLILSELPDQAKPLLERRRQNRRRRFWQTLMSPLSLRLPGLDPTWLFDRVYPWFRWCFSRPALTAAALLILAAIGLLAVYHVEVMHRLPTWQEFFTPGNLLVLLVLTGAIKVLHELGHGLACRHFGGEVHELGVMFLVFAPCLYCNVSDAWRLPKGARIAVGAAGIFVELVLAALAAFGWWLSEPGLFHQFCLGTMFISGVSTLLINGNPLMRYDGYFILSDLIETPNLAEKSSVVVKKFFHELCFKRTHATASLLPERRHLPLAVYCVASAAYRIVLTFSIAMFLIALARPYGLAAPARLYAVIAIGGLLARPIISATRFLTSGGMAKVIPSIRSAFAVATIVAVLALVVFQPLPRCVRGTLELEPQDAEKVYVDVPGLSRRVHYRPGDQVTAGAVLAELENVDLQLEIAQLAGRAGEQRAQISSLRHERFHNDTAAVQIPELEKSLAAINELLHEKRQEASRLILRAARSGTVLPVAETSTRADSAQAELVGWSGLPTDPQNIGSTFSEGTPFCQVGNPHEWQALIVVDQTEIEAVVIGQAVEMRLNHLPDRVLSGRVSAISHSILNESPRRLSHQAGGELATQTDEEGTERPAYPTYQVRVTLENPPSTFRIGLRGTARIHVAAEPLAARAARWATRTFHFHF